MYPNTQVQNEGLCIIRLCKGLSDFIKLGLCRKTFLRETAKFVHFIEKVLTEVDLSVRNTLKTPIVSQLSKSKLREFNQIKEVLSWLYVFTKEAVDADTLSMPCSLTIFLNHIAKKLHVNKDVSLVVLGTSNLMYYKYNLINLRILIQKLKTPVPSCPSLNEDISILKFPYCAAQETLTNCILFHEMGHFFYEYRSLQSQIEGIIEDDLDDFLKKHSSDNHSESTLRKRLLNFSMQVLLRWADEIFADIFAIKILGPAFHLAFRELEQMLPTEDKDRGIDRNKLFFVSHPAIDYRFKMHAKWLSDEKWDDVIIKHEPNIFEQLKKCKELNMDNSGFSMSFNPPLKDNELSFDVVRTWLFEEFEKIVKIIESDICELFKDHEKPINDFSLYNKDVTSYLEHGVVPSTIYDEATRQKCHPNPTTILNSGFFFYLEGMVKLLSRVKNNDSQIDRKVNYGKRLNEWLAKAIEDWHIIQERNKL